MKHLENNSFIWLHRHHMFDAEAHKAKKIILNKLDLHCLDYLQNISSKIFD